MTRTQAGHIAGGLVTNPTSSQQCRSYSPRRGSDTRHPSLARVGHANIGRSTHDRMAARGFSLGPRLMARQAVAVEASSTFPALA